MSTHQNTALDNPQLYDVIIIGAGAAGLMAAATAANRGRQVLLLEHANKLAEKIRISGGGRCNFTNLNTHHERYLSQNPHFCRSALAQYTPHDFLALLKKHGIIWHEKTLGQLFCDESSQEIITMLNTECQAAKVTRMMNTEVLTVYKKTEQTKEDKKDSEKENSEKGASYFHVETTKGNFQSEALIVTTGGLALPDAGATPFGYKIAERFGLSIVPPTPALVPLALHKEELERLAPLAGISLMVKVSLDKTSFYEKMLITHKGLSGPAILQISSYWKPGQSLSINLLPQQNITELLQKPQYREKKISTVLMEKGWPRRFAETWFEMQGIKDTKIKELNSKSLQQLVEQIECWQIMPNGTQGYRLAEVTLGGVDTNGLSSKTMEANICPKLYFAGEVIDVTGWLGGYNFQWAWSSGFVAGMNA